MARTAKGQLSFQNTVDTINININKGQDYYIEGTSSVE